MSQLNSYQSACTQVYVLDGVCDAVQIWLLASVASGKEWDGGAFFFFPLLPSDSLFITLSLFLYFSFLRVRERRVLALWDCTALFNNDPC